MIDTADMAFPKPVKLQKERKPLKSKTRLKSHVKPIPKKLKEEVLKAPGLYGTEPEYWKNIAGIITALLLSDVGIYGLMSGVKSLNRII